MTKPQQISKPDALYVFHRLQSVLDDIADKLLVRISYSRNYPFDASKVYGDHDFYMRGNILSVNAVEDDAKEIITLQKRIEFFCRRAAKQIFADLGDYHFEVFDVVGSTTTEHYVKCETHEEFAKALLAKYKPDHISPIVNRVLNFNIKLSIFNPAMRGVAVKESQQNLMPIQQVDQVLDAAIVLADTLGIELKYVSQPISSNQEDPNTLVTGISFADVDAEHIGPLKLRVAKLCKQVAGMFEPLFDKGMKLYTDGTLNTATVDSLATLLTKNAIEQIAKHPFNVPIFLKIVIPNEDE